MGLMPTVTTIERTDGAVTLAINVSPSLDYFPGHFPGFPILPGVVQINWAIHLAREYLDVPATGFSSMRMLKFSAPILPGASLSLRVSWLTDKSRLDFSYRDGARTASSGQIVFSQDVVT